MTRPRSGGSSRVRLTSACLCLAVLAGLTSPVFAQPSAPAADNEPTPALRRWLDVQSIHVGSRFRWFKNSSEVLRSSTLQWQSQLRGRFLFDREGRYFIGTLASTGASFPSSWNNTGGGLGTFTGPFNVKQLFVAAEPVRGLELQAGGLFMNRGELGEHVTYDNDAYIVGERVTYRPANSRITQVSLTGGYSGDYNEVLVFKRLDRMNDFNYGQALIGFTIHPRVAASVDYTYEDGRDILREGVNVRLPSSAALLTGLRFEAYQRVSEPDGYGFNVSGDFRWRRLSVTAGVMSVDRHYGPFNGDRYETGTRQYTIGTFQITPEFSLGWFQTEAIATEFPINLKHRVDFLAIFNPTAALKRAGVF
jgi:hypothetical protein